MEQKIKCPYCGYEYLPAEIYIPESVIGTPHNIVRSEKGEIEFYEGDDLDLEECYICDNCGKEFVVKGEISFKTNKVCEDNQELDDDFEIKIK